MKSVSRRSFLRTAGVTAGAAAVSAQTAVAAVAEPGPLETTPTAPLPAEAIVAILRDPARPEVTVLSGTTEKTYSDRLLANRILKAANRNLGSGPKGVA